MNVEEKILTFLEQEDVIGNAELSEIKISKEKNKNDENLLFVSAANLEKPLGRTNLYTNNAMYYGFNLNGDYIGYVMVNVINVNPPSKIELEYCANEQFQNQGNITVLAKEVIREIFEDRAFDGLKTRNNAPLSNINSIFVSISPMNYASLAVARKLGLESGRLQKSEYLASKDSTGLKH